LLTTSIRVLRLSQLSLAPLLAGACKEAASSAPPLPEVAVVTIAPRTVNQDLNFVGTVEASRSVQVRAQVEGVIVQRAFVEGRLVSAGETLYRIDPTTYDAAWRGAKARLAEAEARLANAEQNLARLKSLVSVNAISRQEYDNAEAEAKAARATVEDAHAVVDQAKKNLDDTSVRAELGGRVGKALLEAGARVRGSDDILTTIDVLDPIYITFKPSGQQLLSWKRDPRSSNLLVPGSPLKVTAILPDNRPAPTTGRITFIDPVLDPATGTQTFRASFHNLGRLMVPGQFARVKLAGLTRDSAILVPQRAVLQQMGREIVYVVGVGDSVKPRDVDATGWSGDQWLIEEGLAAGDRVVVDGIQKIGPGLVVKPVPLADSTAMAPEVLGAAAKHKPGGSP